jgi:hypothetical protein
MNQIQISVLYELIVFVCKIYLHEILKLRKTAKKKYANLPQIWDKLADEISRSNFENLQFSIS